MTDTLRYSLLSSINKRPYPYRDAGFPIGDHTPISLQRLQHLRDVWGLRTFGDKYFTLEEFAFRFLEEAVELVQSLDLTQLETQHLVSHVFSRPKGEPSQEIAGTLITLLSVASALHISAEEAVLHELNRISEPATAKSILDRQIQKRQAGLTRSAPTDRPVGPLPPSIFIEEPAK